MKLGVNVGYWGMATGRPADQLAVVQEAERLGFDSAWAAEAYGSDAATVLGWLAAGTETIRLGSAIFQMPARSPAMTAMTAATLDVLSGGRMLLGIGSSGPQVAEGWHGQRFAHQLQRTREYVAVVRTAAAVTRRPPDVVRDRLAAFRDAGVGTLALIPMATDRAQRIAQLRAVAELAG
jgi:alkanesulfonate monooxygenase SsuD/methylene tetrahydromethanopterin reductase-like flavin-dependent oxidoreductase (luciferase family)